MTPKAIKAIDAVILGFALVSLALGGIVAGLLWYSILTDVRCPL